MHIVGFVIGGAAFEGVCTEKHQGVQDLARREEIVGMAKAVAAEAICWRKGILLRWIVHSS
jgi:hypothetical protein